MSSAVSSTTNGSNTRVSVTFYPYFSSKIAWTMSDASRAGKHFMAYVRLAFDFFKPVGELRALLPTSAEVNKMPAHIRLRAWTGRRGSGWRGLWRWLLP